MKRENKQQTNLEKNLNDIPFLGTVSSIITICGFIFPSFSLYWVIKFLIDWYHSNTYSLFFFISLVLTIVFLVISIMSQRKC